MAFISILCYYECVPARVVVRHRTGQHTGILVKVFVVDNQADSHFGVVHAVAVRVGVLFYDADISRPGIWLISRGPEDKNNDSNPQSTFAAPASDTRLDVR